MNVLSFRWGHFEEHAYNGGRDFDTTGWGIDLFYFAYDTSVSIGDQRISTFTVRVPLGGEAEGNFWPELLDLVGW